MKKRHVIVISVLMAVVLSLALLMGCTAQQEEKPEGTLTVPELLEKPEGTLTVAELLENPVYDTEVKIYGTVSLLGELNCPCFELTSGGQKVLVWYRLMVEDGGTERPSVSVEGIENGDWVVVTGELKSEGEYRSLNDFWASKIEKY